MRLRGRIRTDQRTQGEPGSVAVKIATYSTSSRIPMKYRDFPLSLARAALFLFCLAIAATGLAQPKAAAPDAGARDNSIARLLAGYPSTYGPHADFMERDEWKQHSATLKASWDRLDQEQAAPLKAWRDANLPHDCPAGRTLLYPFSGPDFFNAHWFFPACDTIVMFGLERVGEVPAVEKMTPAQFSKLLAGVREAMANLLARNYFITSHMGKDLHTSEIRGVLPIIMISMAFSGLEIVRIGTIVLDPPATAEPPEPVEGGAKPPRALRGLTIDFRQPGSQKTQRLHYFSGDVTDKGLARYPQFIDYVRKLAPATTLLKSASYLLHANDFAKIRAAILGASGYIIQDDTGLPYSTLVKSGWEVRVYGRYLVPIRPFESYFQHSLAKVFEEQKAEPLPFRFGYRKGPKDDRSNVIIATRRPAAGTGTSGRPGAEPYKR